MCFLQCVHFAKVFTYGNQVEVWGPRDGLRPQGQAASSRAQAPTALSLAQQPRLGWTVLTPHFSVAAYGWCLPYQTALRPCTDPEAAPKPLPHGTLKGSG